MYKIVDTENGYYLLKNKERDAFTVVRKAGDGLEAEARDAMPGDAPKGGGEWTASWSRKGVDYVASWYSYSWAREVFNRRTRSAKDKREARLAY